MVMSRLSSVGFGVAGTGTTTGRITGGAMGFGGMAAARLAAASVCSREGKPVAFVVGFVSIHRFYRCHSENKTTPTHGGMVL